MALGRGVPDPPATTKVLPEPSSRHRRGESYPIRAASVLGGLHHEYSPPRAGVIGLLRATALNDRVATHIADKASEAVVGPGQ